LPSTRSRSAATAAFQRVYCNGAHRGFRNSPGGESGGLCSNGSNSKILNCEVDCRNPATGLRVATSPFMFNSCSNVTVTDFYGHHSYAGMPTCNGVRRHVHPSAVRVQRLRQRCPVRVALNFERCSGTFNLYDPTLYCNYQNNYDPTQPVNAGSGNVGAHIGGGSDIASTVINVYNPTYDYGSDGPNRVGGYRFDFQFQPTYAGATQKQLNTDFHVYDAAGSPIAFKVRS
jgi:hypothetical protein